jgi:hypothetical protein
MREQEVGDARHDRDAGRGRSQPARKRLAQFVCRPRIVAAAVKVPGPTIASGAMIAGIREAFNLWTCDFQDGGADRLLKFTQPLAG